jgi:hypothetical protein
MRRRLLRWAVDGAAYVPFIGDGDIAVELYADRHVLGGDIDGERVAVASSRLPTADIRTADCDPFVFPGLKKPRIAVADFDAYAYPYTSFRSFWKHAPKTNRLVLFFTDGQGLNVSFKGRWRGPDGVECRAPGMIPGKAAGDLNVRRATWAFWWQQTVWPWFTNLVEPEWKILDRFRYVRGTTMLYWGAVIETRPKRT